MAANVPLTREILELLEGGLLSFAKLDDAAALAGVHRGTLWRWRKRAQELVLAYRDDDAPAHGPPTPDELLFLRLHDVLDQSSPAAKTRALMEIRRAGLGTPVRVTTTTTITSPPVPASAGKPAIPEQITTKVVVVERTERSWQALAWLLERTHPDEFALVNRTEHTLGGALVPDGEEGDELLALGYDLIDQVAERRRRNEAEAARTDTG